MTKVTRVIIKDLLEFFQHLRVIRWKIEALLLGLTVGVTLLTKSVLEYDVVILAKELVKFKSFSVIANGTSNCKLICGIHRRILILIILSLSNIIFNHLKIKFKLFNFISNALLLLLSNRKLIQFVESFLELDLLHFVIITLDLSALDHEECVINHLLKLEHEDILGVLDNVLIESQLRVIITSEQNGNRYQKCLFLDIQLLFKSDEIANQIYSTQFIKHGLLLFDLHREINPIFRLPFNRRRLYLLVHKLDDLSYNLQTYISQTFINIAIYA